MKKRIVSALVCAAMLASMAVVPVAAEEATTLTFLMDANTPMEGLQACFDLDFQNFRLQNMLRNPHAIAPLPLPLNAEISQRNVMKATSPFMRISYRKNRGRKNRRRNFKKILHFCSF